VASSVEIWCEISFTCYNLIVYFNCSLAYLASPASQIFWIRDTSLIWIIPNVNVVNIYSKTSNNEHLSYMNTPLYWATSGPPERIFLVLTLSNIKTSSFWMRTLFFGLYHVNQPSVIWTLTYNATYHLVNSMYSIGLFEDYLLKRKMHRQNRRSQYYLCNWIMYEM